MSVDLQGEHSRALDQREHNNDASGKRVVLRVFDSLTGTWSNFTGGGGLSNIAWDYVAYTNTSTTVDTYVYKSGGSGGTTVKTLTITYTDTTKSQISNIAWT